jgi:hypothetical protein
LLAGFEGGAAAAPGEVEFAAALPEDFPAESEPDDVPVDTPVVKPSAPKPRRRPAAAEQRSLFE